MTTIGSFAAGSYRSTASANRSAGLRAQFDDLSNQLTTGKVSDSYAGLGLGRRTSLDARARIAALAATDQAITRAQTGVKVASLSLTQVSTSATTAKSLLQQSTQGLGADTLVTSIAERLASVIDALNQSVDGRSLFAGRATDVTPVETIDHILDGDGAKAGVATLIAERKAADLGAGATKTGRLALSTTGSTVALAQDASASVRANFGFTIQGATSSNGTAIAATASAGTAAAATLTFGTQPSEGDVVRVVVNNADGTQSTRDLVAMANPPSGSTTAFAIGATAAATGANLTTLLSGQAVASAQSATPPSVSLALSGGTAGSVSLAVNAQPAAGDTVTVTLGLRDGTMTTLTLTAAAAGSSAAGTFAIGATTADTAANLQAALGTALDAAATGPLAASSAMRAAEDFFAGSSAPGLAPRRIAGGAPYTGATGFSTASSTASTVIWYKGETSADPRGTAAVPLGEGQSAKVGATADEPALRNVMASLAAFAAESFGTGTAEESRLSALSERVQAALTPADGEQTVQDISNDFARASAAMSTAQTDNKAATAVLQDAIGEVEDADPNEVATRLVDLQTRLQASYQTTAILSKLSLVNFL